VSTPPKPPRSFRQWLLLAVNAVLAGVVAVVGLGLAYGNWRFNGIDRTTITKGILTPTVASTPVNILLVGSDSRASFTGRDQKSFGDAKAVEGQRSDTMMVVRIVPGSNEVMVLSIPRDLWVKLAQVSVEDKINQAFDGGPSRLIATIQENLGLTINHFVQVDFSGFRQVVDSIGGISLYVPYPARDPMTGLDIKNAGCNKLVGEQALAYVRSRYYEEHRDGRWRTDPTADLGRITRQQRFLRQTFRQSVASIGPNPLALDRLLSSLLATVTVDDTFQRSEMLSLARRLRGVNPDNVLTYVLPVYSDTSADHRSILRLSQVDATGLLNLFNGFAPGGDTNAVVKPTPDAEPGQRCA
jgi:polyisoprenyl-teichoic acid--peptidoglycan teichoic acid transferase